jgi:hypothetical protein
MSRNRILIVAGVLLVFIAAGGALIFANSQHGAQNVTFNVRVTAAKTMSPSNLSARQGDTLTINMSSDTDGEVHLHGYDIAFDTKSGQTVSHTFKASTTCRCDIEWESTSTPLGTLVVSP